MTNSLLAKFEGVNGGVVAVDLPVGATHAIFKGENQLIVDNTAIVAIPLDQEPGQPYLRVLLSGNLATDIHFTVNAKKYPEQHITISDEKMVTPPEEVLERIGRESARMKEAYALRTRQQPDLFPILIPVSGPVSGVFGSRRVFNGKPRNPHSGIDYAADEGTPIVAPAPGTVALTGDLYFNGNTVVIDHGGGFVSVMCHLHEVFVEVNQQLKRGDTIGTVGSTGRSTGPHLHWTISLQGTKVDPAVFMDVTNQLAKKGKDKKQE
ncbi:MAG: peptidoglycan DD-metalloendopeptidase family protein [Gammaproteobacteria bacterium]|nr:peptidoglycan DD-metalloendopeptidase family protein [Gammaproteobacteria bacterium]